MISDSRKIKEVRQVLRLSQSELSRKLGFSSDIVKCWENGWRTPPQHILKQMDNIIRYKGGL